MSTIKIKSRDLVRGWPHPRSTVAFGDPFRHLMKLWLAEDSPDTSKALDEIRWDYAYHINQAICQSENRTDIQKLFDPKYSLSVSWSMRQYNFCPGSKILTRPEPAKQSVSVRLSGRIECQP